MKNTVKKAFIWFLLFSKRLLKRKSFLCVLCIIPIIFPITNIALQDNSSVMKIAISGEDSSVASKSAVKFWVDKNSIVDFINYESPEKAKEAVLKYEVDTAWIFKDNLDERIDKFISGKNREPFIEIIEREDTVILKLVREVIYGSIFEDVSYCLYKNYSYNNIKGANKIEEKEMRRIYNSISRNDSIVKLRTLSKDIPIEKDNYLLTPLRGILSLMPVLSTLAAAMFFLDDKKKGKYDWLPVKKHIIPAFALCFSAALFTGTAVCLSICMTSLSKGVLFEITSMILFIIACVGFGLPFCVLFKSPGRLGAFLPGIMISLLVLSPIFFNVSILRPISLMLPTHYYLRLSGQNFYYLYIFIYCVCAYALAFLLNNILNESVKRIK